uniref:Uncharacterized protein n=1 Tax=Timema genevievae TaxID=629358 RepID=A0A7R9K5B1_TIMGE|nr:unnamed protein product [Timema genevievae]
MLSLWKRDRKTGERQRMLNFCVNMTPREHTARLYSIPVLCGVHVKVEKYKSPSGPVKCKNCFRFGHVQKDSHLNPRISILGLTWLPDVQVITDSGACTGLQGTRREFEWPKPEVLGECCVTESGRDSSTKATGIIFRQAEVPAETTPPELDQRGSSLPVENLTNTALLLIPTFAPRSILFSQDEVAKLKDCIETLKGIPELEPWDFSSSLLRKVQEFPSSNHGYLVRRGLDYPVISLPPLQHMEATDIQLVNSSGPVRLITIYLPPYHRNSIPIIISIYSIGDSIIVSIFVVRILCIKNPISIII